MEETLKKTKQPEALKQFRKRFIKEFLDLIILARLKSVPYITGYDTAKYIDQECKIFLSSGTIYSTLYSMERDGLLRGELKGEKRIYCITPQGEEAIRTINEKIDIIKSLFHYFKTFEPIEISKQSRRQPIIRTVEE